MGRMSGFSSQLIDDETERIERIRIDIGSGLVHISSNPDGEGTVVSLEVDEGSEEDVIFELADGELIVEGPRKVRRGPEIVVRIATSEVLDARVKTGSGDISSEMPLGSARLSTGSGDVQLTPGENDLAVSTRRAGGGRGQGGAQGGRGARGGRGRPPPGSGSTGRGGGGRPPRPQHRIR